MSDTVCSVMKRVVGDLLLELKFVKLGILSTLFIYFLYDKLGDLRSRTLWVNTKVHYSCLTLHLNVSISREGRQEYLMSDHELSYYK